MEDQKVWMVTGVVSGLGLASVKYILSRGGRVIVVTMDPLQSEVNPSLVHPNLKVVSLDYNSETAMAILVQQLKLDYERIDFFLNYHEPEAFATAWNKTHIRRNAFMQLFVDQILTLVKYVLPHMLTSTCAHIFFVSFNGKSKRYEQVTSYRFGVLKMFVNKCGKALNRSNIKVSVIDEENYITNYVSCTDD